MIPAASAHPIARAAGLTATAAALAGLAFFAGAGCDLDRNEGILMAAGSYGDVAVLLSSEGLRPAVQPFLDRLNRPVRFVIKDEPPFTIDIYGPAKWEVGRGYKNVVFLVDWSDRGAVMKAASGLLSDENRALVSRGGIARLDEPYARYQFALIVGAPDRNSLASLLARSGGEIERLLQTRTLERIQERNRHEGVQTALAERYRQSYGFAMEIPAGYKENQVLPDLPALEWMRTGPSRGITLAWQESDDPAALLRDREELLRLRERLGRDVHDEELIPETLVWQEAELAGRPALKLEGAWAGEEFAGGGPFWTYFVPDAAAGRLWCLDLLAYAPDQPKMPLFREMLAVISTFRSEPAAHPAAAR